MPPGGTCPYAHSQFKQPCLPMQHNTSCALLPVDAVLVIADFLLEKQACTAAAVQAGSLLDCLQGGPHHT